MNVRKTWPLLAAVAAVGYLLLPYPLVIAAESAAAIAKDSAAPLTLSQALALALKHNPELSAFSHELRAGEAAILQAGVLPNPVLGIEADNLNNDRLRQDGDRTTAIQIGQLIELGGKRAARIRMAEAGRDLANWDYEAKRIDVLSRVSQHFIDTMAAQQARELAAESLKLAQNVAAAVARRVQAGKVSPIEETKARLALSAAQIEAEQAERQLAAARRNLSSMWGNAAPAFTAAAGDLENLSLIHI